MPAGGWTDFVVTTNFDRTPIFQEEKNLSWIQNSLNKSHRSLFEALLRTSSVQWPPLSSSGKLCCWISLSDKWEESLFVWKQVYSQGLSPEMADKKTELEERNYSSKYSRTVDRTCSKRLVRLSFIKDHSNELHIALEKTHIHQTKEMFVRREFVSNVLLELRSVGTLYKNIDHIAVKSSDTTSMIPWTYHWSPVPITWSLSLCNDVP